MPFGPIPIPILNGWLVSAPPAPAIYLIYGGAKFYIPSQAELTALGLAGNPIHSISQQQLDRVPTTPRDGTLLKERIDPHVWTIGGGRKIWLPTGAAVEHTGGWGNVGTVPPGALDAFPSIQLQSLAATPPSMVFAMNGNPADSPFNKWYPRPDLPGVTLPNGSNVVTLRGWLRGFDMDCNAQDPDWGMSLEPDVRYLDSFGVGITEFFQLGDILHSSLDTLTPNQHWAWAATPQLHMELAGWPPTNIRVSGHLPPDWKALFSAEPECGQARWAFDPRQVAAVGAYVEVAGTIVTDEPHVNNGPGDYQDASQIWQRGGNTYRPDNPPRYNEMHSPDWIGPATAPENPDALWGVAVVGAWGLPRALDVVLRHRFPQPPATKLAISEHVLRVANLATITAGNATKTGAAIVLARDSARVQITVQEPGIAGSGRFAAIYRLSWVPA